VNRKRLEGIFQKSNDKTHRKDAKIAKKKKEHTNGEKDESRKMKNELKGHCEPFDGAQG
jgi:hypothetical protein